MRIVCVGLIAIGCSTTPPQESGRQRQAPAKIFTDCKEVTDALLGREQFYESLRGQAVLRTTSRGGLSAEKVEVDVAMSSPHFLRAELRGPLGIRLGLLQVNQDWVQFYDARKRLVKRLPFEEFQRNSLRREAFLAELPIAMPDPFVVDAALSRVGIESFRDLREGYFSKHCPFSEELSAYEIVYKTSLPGVSGAERWHRVFVDAADFFPLRHTTRVAPRSKRKPSQLTPAFWDAGWEWEMKYSRFVGKGIGTLPRLLQVSNRGAMNFEFEWISAEPIRDRGAEIFQWRPSASMRVNDY